jgi:signal transduction histidine kinase
MKNAQTIQTNYSQVILNELYLKPVSYLKKIWAAFVSSRLFTAKRQIIILQQQADKNEQEIARLKWELLQKNEQVKNIAFHQSHTVRRPLANILGIIELLNCNKININYSERQELIGLLKISADHMDKAIKQNSTVGKP